MNRHEIAEVTYKAGFRLNRLKAKHGLIPNEMAKAIMTCQLKPEVK